MPRPAETQQKRRGPLPNGKNVQRPSRAKGKQSAARRASAGRMLLDFGEPVYKAGARLLVSDATAKIISRVFVPIELRLERLPEDHENFLREPSPEATRSASRALCVVAQEPKTRAKSRLVLRDFDVAAFRKSLQGRNDVGSDARASEVLDSGLEAMQAWLQGRPGASMPPTSALTLVLGNILCCARDKNRFEVHCDVTRLPKLERAALRSQQLSETRKKESHRIEHQGSREIKLAPGEGPPRRNDNEWALGCDVSDSESESADEAAPAAYQTTQNIKEQNERVRAARAASVGDHVSVAELAVRSIAGELRRQQDGLDEQSVTAAAFEAREARKLGKLRDEHAKRQEENRAYRMKMHEAVAANELALKLEAKARRDKVRHVRDMARMKWSCFPFANGGRWQKGVVIGPGPLPIRKLALLRRPHHENGVFGSEDAHRPGSYGSADADADGASQALSSLGSGQGGSKGAHNQHDRLAAAFQLLRGLAKTYDSHYLDFDRAFHRLDRKSRGFLRPGDLRVMLRPLRLTEDDTTLLWSHFDRNGSGFVSKDDLVWGFYNKRQVLREAQRTDESVLYRADVLDRILHQRGSPDSLDSCGDRNAAEGGVAVSSKSNSETRRSELTQVHVRIGGLRGLRGVPARYSVFCIASSCQICKEEGEDTLVISSESRSGAAVASLAGTGPIDSAEATWTASAAHIELTGISQDLLEMEHILLEFRATAPGATSDVKSLFLGEIFFPLTQLDLRTARNPVWVSLRHGDHRGEALVQVCVGEPSATHFETSQPRATSAPATNQIAEDVDRFPRERAAAQTLLLSLLQDAMNPPQRRPKSAGETTEAAELEDARFEEERIEARSKLQELLAFGR